MPTRRISKGVPKGEAYNLQLQEPTGDPYLDFWATTCALAFKDAEGGDADSQAFLRATFRPRTLAYLQAQQLVNWYFPQEESDMDTLADENNS
ncbi:MAG TPA: hypothetical protein PKH77_04285 [Anaerolineae bacterium]|nr:hypothetical protein [Anaerolineae bacterium]